MRAFVYLLVVAVFAPTVALGQPRQPRQRQRQPQQQPAGGGEAAPPAPTLADLATIVPKLSSANADEVREAIDLLSVIDRPEVVPPLATLLRSGQPDAITDRALEALGGLAHPSAIDVLGDFTHHRRAGARRRAYQALSAIRDNRVPRLLQQGLRDSDRSVRGAVALALGDIGARDSIEILFRAFDRGVLEAAIAIGKLGEARSVARFNEYLGRQALSVMLSGYEQYLKRRDIPDAIKLDIVARLGEVSGGTVKRFLQDLLATFDARDRGPVRRAVEDTIRRIPDDAPRRGPAATPAPTPAATPAPTPAAATPAPSTQGGAR